MAMGSFVVSCVLLAVIPSLSVICGSDMPPMNTGEFPASITGFPPNHSDLSREELNDSDDKAEMSRMMENHLLRMLKLSSRPPARVSESLVPGYVRALQHAVDDIPLSATALDTDHLTWAIKAVQGIYLLLELTHAQVIPETSARNQGHLNLGGMTLFAS